MPLTNSPGGIASWGVPVLPQDAFSGPAYFVCNRAGVINGPGTSMDRPQVSIADALAKLSTDATQGSRIFVLEGHAENVTASNTFSGAALGPNLGAQTIPAGCRIIGLGVGRARPTLTFTAAGSTLTLAAANSGLENMNLLCAQTGSVTNTALVTVTAQGCLLRSLNMQLAATATALATTGVSMSSAANETVFDDVTQYTVTGTPTSGISTTGTTGPSRVKVTRCMLRLLLSSTTGGVIDTSAASGTAPADWDISYSDFANNTAASTVVLKFVASMTGMVRWCGIGFKNATGAATVFNAFGNVENIETYATTVGKAGLIAGTVSG